jgi:hypothetical protein
MRQLGNAKTLGLEIFRLGPSQGAPLSPPHGGPKRWTNACDDETQAASLSILVPNDYWYIALKEEAGHIKQGKC